eukprot:g2446.t1
MEENNSLSTSTPQNLTNPSSTNEKAPSSKVSSSNSTISDAASEWKKKEASYKRLIALAKKSIASKQATIVEKDKVIASLSKSSSSSSEEKATPLSSSLFLPPLRVLCRVEDFTSSKKIWCLVEYDDGTATFWKCPHCQYENDLEIDSCEMCGAENPETPKSTKNEETQKSRKSKSNKTGWELESTLVERAKRDFDISLSLPAVSLSESEIDQLQDELQAAEDELVKTKAEFRKYRVRAELTIKQKENNLETTRKELKDSFGDKIRSIAGTDISGELKRAKAEAQVLRKETEMVQTSLANKTEEVSNLTRECEELRSALEASQIASAEWRRQFEGKVQAERERAVRGAVADAQSDGRNQQLKKEFDEYKTRAMNVMQEREATLQATLQQLAECRDNPSMVDSSSGSSPQMNYMQGKYLRNVVLQYMTTNDASEKQRIEIAVAQILRFTDAEIQLIKERREKETSWTGGWI